MGHLERVKAACERRKTPREKTRYYRIYENCKHYQEDVLYVEHQNGLNRRHCMTLVIDGGISFRAQISTDEWTFPDSREELDKCEIGAEEVANMLSDYLHMIGYANNFARDEEWVLVEQSSDAFNEASVDWHNAQFLGGETPSSDCLRALELQILERERQFHGRDSDPDEYEEIMLQIIEEMGDDEQFSNKRRACVVGDGNGLREEGPRFQSCVYEGLHG